MEGIRLEIEGAVLHLDGRPTFEIRDGLVFITLKSGNCLMRRSATIHSFRREVEFCKRMLDDWDRDQRDKIVRM